MGYHMSWLMTIPNTPNLSKYVLYIIYIYIIYIYPNCMVQVAIIANQQGYLQWPRSCTYYIIYVNILYLFNALIEKTTTVPKTAGTVVSSQKLSDFTQISMEPHQDMKKGSHLAKIRYQRRSLLQWLKIASHSRLAAPKCPKSQADQIWSGTWLLSNTLPPHQKKIAELYYIRTY